MTKLTREQVEWARRAYAAKEANQYELARLLGVSQPTIRSALIGRTWKQ